MTVRTETEAAEREFPAGTFLVRLDQPHAGYAVSVLEPESENGFVSFRVTEARTGELLPIYRLNNL